MMRRDLYLKMVEDCKWFVENKCFFDSIWAWWSARWSNLYYMSEPLIAYRLLNESDSHSIIDKNKSLYLLKRYYRMKLQFLLTQQIPIETSIDVLMSEYDYLYQNAKFDGVLEVSKSKAYKIGKTLLKPIKMIQTFLNK